MVAPRTAYACPSRGFTAATTVRTMYAIPITRYPIVPTSFRGVPPRDYIYSISHASAGFRRAIAV
jgi:hypothetical protein